MPSKFVPKIPPRAGFAGASITNEDSLDPNHQIHCEGNVIVIRVKRRRDEICRETLVVSRDDSERVSKRFVTPQNQMSRLSVDTTVPERRTKQPTETKIFKLIGTASIDSPISCTGSLANDIASGDTTAAFQEAQNILKKISERGKVQGDRNVKRDNGRQQCSAESRLR